MVLQRHLTLKNKVNYSELDGAPAPKSFLLKKKIFYGKEKYSEIDFMVLFS